jgi:hypothetical protein
LPKFAPGNGDALKDRAKSFLSVWNIRDSFVDHRVDSGDKRLAKKADRLTLEFCACESKIDSLLCRAVIAVVRSVITFYPQFAPVAQLDRAMDF